MTRSEVLISARGFDVLFDLARYDQDIARQRGVAAVAQQWHQRRFCAEACCLFAGSAGYRALWPGLVWRQTLTLPPIGLQYGTAIAFLLPTLRGGAS